MKAKKIRKSEIEKNGVSSLPTYPTSHGAFEKGMSATELKAAFDRLPQLIIEHLNALIDDISAEPDVSVAAEIKTGIRENHTLAELFRDVENGTFSAYLSVGDSSLAIALADIRVRLSKIERRLGENV